MFCVYKYVLNNEIIYVGQTTRLKERIKQHSKEINFNNKNIKIYYYNCFNEKEMDCFEFFLINKYHPKFNLKDNYIELNYFNFPEIQWILYEEGKNLNKEPQVKKVIVKKETIEEKERLYDVEEKERLYSVKDIADIVGCSKPTIQKIINMNDIEPFKKIGMSVKNAKQLFSEEQKEYILSFLNY